MTEENDALLRTLQKPDIPPSDRRAIEQHLLRQRVYLSEPELQKLRYLLGNGRPA